MADEPLDELLLRALRAARNDRIDLRDAIAAHGALAVEAMEDWLSDPGLVHFAIRVVAKAGFSGGRDEAIRALTSLANDQPALWSDISLQLHQLGVELKKPSKAGPPSWTRRHPYAVENLPASAGLSWPGFQVGEFGDVTGTTWRRRTDPQSLPPLILRALREVHPHFSSWSIYRSAQVHFAVTDRYRQFDEPESGWRAAKLVVYAHGPSLEHKDTVAEAVAGMYIEKGDGKAQFGPVDARWDWPRFVTSLTDPATASPLAAAMERHHLSFGDFFGQRFGPGTQIGGVGRMEEGEFIFRGHDQAELFRGFAAMRHHLEQLPGEDWHDLHLWRAWPAQVAAKAGPRFAMDALVPVLEDLARIYVGIVRDALAEGVRAMHRVEQRRTLPDGSSEIVCLIQAHDQTGHFGIPKRVMDELGIPLGGRVRLTVETLEGTRYYSGELSTRSGPEVYHRVSDDETRGLEQIRPKEWIRVTVSNPQA